MSLLGSFGRSARTRGWAVLDSLRSKELTKSVYQSKKKIMNFKTGNLTVSPDSHLPLCWLVRWSRSYFSCSELSLVILHSKSLHIKRVLVVSSSLWEVWSETTFKLLIECQIGDRSHYLKRDIYLVLWKTNKRGVYLILWKTDRRGVYLVLKKAQSWVFIYRGVYRLLSGVYLVL